MSGGPGGGHSSAGGEGWCKVLSHWHRVSLWGRAQLRIWHRHLRWCKVRTWCVFSAPLPFFLPCVLWLKGWGASQFLLSLGCPGKNEVTGSKEQISTGIWHRHLGWCKMMAHWHRARLWGRAQLHIRRTTLLRIWHRHLGWFKVRAQCFFGPTANLWRYTS